MPKHYKNRRATSKRKHSTETSTSTPKAGCKTRSYTCRLCQRPHPLRLCRKFLALEAADRMEMVRKHKYCVNCLAHDHSHGTCFSEDGCRRCKKFHHTLLHPNEKTNNKPRSRSKRSKSRSASPRPKLSRGVPSKSPPTSRPTMAYKPASLAARIQQNTVILLPTVVAKIEGQSVRAAARCLLDSGSPISRVSKQLVERLSLTTLTLKDETICPLTLRSRFVSGDKVEVTLRVDNRISLQTPIESLPQSLKKGFPHLFLADPAFFKTGPIDIVLGVDVYAKVLAEGMYTRPGLPTAQSTIFGWMIYGSYSM